MMTLLAFQNRLPKGEENRTRRFTIAETGDDANGVETHRRTVHLTNAGLMDREQTGLVASCLGDLETRPIVWLWGELVSRGMVTVLAGPSGVGKSFVAIDVAAAVTRGDRKTLREPETQTAATTSDAQDVLFISPEYEIADVLRPRLAAAGAQLQRMHVIHGIRAKDEDCVQDECRTIQLQEDLPLLKQEIERRHASGSPLRLIVVDPFFQEPLNDRSDRADFISTMQQLARIAAATQVAILLVVNCPSKATANLRTTPLELIAQSVWWIDNDPYRPERRLLLPVKIKTSAAPDTDWPTGQPVSRRWPIPCPSAIAG